MEYILSQTTYNTYGQPVTQAVPFGEFLPRTMEVILVIGSLLMALIYRLKINTILASAYNGIKKMIKPILYYCWWI